MQKSDTLRLAITTGDYNGIGPEIILKSYTNILDKGVTPVVLGDQKIFGYHARQLKIDLPAHQIAEGPQDIQDGMLNFVPLIEQAPRPELGTCHESAGRYAMQSVERGIDWCMQKYTHALITAPISKEAVNKAGYRIPGHTEFLAEKTGTDDFMMMLVNGGLRLGLVTIHIPVADVAGKLNTHLILSKINILHRTLTDDFGIKRPKIAILGLNPHAGDGGIIGREEIEMVTPAIHQAQAKGWQVSGPYPADGFFGNKKYEKYDAVLAMYHDQGLVPFKTLSFGGGVNVTAGLPIVRTSPDHGTAFDIAGRGEANPSSFLQAVNLARALAKTRFNPKITGA